MPACLPLGQQQPDPDRFMALFEGNTSTYSAWEPPKQLQMAQMRLSPSSILQHSRLQRLFWQKGVRVPFCLHVWLHISAAELHRWLSSELRALSIQIVLQGCSVQKVPRKMRMSLGWSALKKSTPCKAFGATLPPSGKHSSQPTRMGSLHTARRSFRLTWASHSPSNQALKGRAEQAVRWVMVQ